MIHAVGVGDGQSGWRGRVCRGETQGCRDIISVKWKSYLGNRVRSGKRRIGQNEAVDVPD